LAVRGGVERLGVGDQLLLARQAAVPEQEDHFLEGRVLDEIIDVVAAIDEPALLAVDEADVRRRYDDIFETAPASGTHGLPSPKGVMKPVCFYHTPENASRHPRARAGGLRRAPDQRGARARSPRRTGAWRP